MKMLLKDPRTRHRACRGAQLFQRLFNSIDQNKMIISDALQSASTQLNAKVICVRKTKAQI